MKKKPTRRTVLLMSLGLAFALQACTNAAKEQSKTPEKPNIILMFTDELQFEDLGFCGGVLPSPHIDQLAADGLYFENTYTPASMCTPSRYSVLSGRYPGRCSDPLFLEKNPTSEAYNIGWNTHLDKSVQTIPRLLSAQGYHTGMVGKWHLSALPGAGRGFSLEDDPADPEVNALLMAHQKKVAAKVCSDGGFDEARSVMFGNFDGFPVEALRTHHYPWFNKGALEFLEERAEGDKPFFLYLAATSLHGPHHAKDLLRDYSHTPEGRLEGMNALTPDLEQLAEEIRDMPSHQSHRYAGMVFLDHQVGLVMDKLEALGMAENTVVIFMPDHNVEPGKSACYEKGVRIPMVIRWPGKTKGGSLSAARVQTMDLLPTILDMAGVSLPSDYLVDGTSLLPVIEDPATAHRELIFLESGYTRAVHDGRYKYIAFRYPESMVEAMQNGAVEQAPTHTIKPGGQAILNWTFYPSYWESDQLYDLSTDPYEQRNLAADPAHAEVLSALQDALKEHLAGFDHPFDLAPPPFVESDTFLKLVEQTTQLTPNDIPWYARDWGEISWPPK